MLVFRDRGVCNRFFAHSETLAIMKEKVLVIKHIHVGRDEVREESYSIVVPDEDEISGLSLEDITFIRNKLTDFVSEADTQTINFE